MNRYAAILLGLLVMAGGTALADTDSFDISHDSFVDGGGYTNNYGGNTIARIRHENDTWGDNNPLVKFDLTGLPYGITVNYARFAFWVDLSDADGSWSPANSFPEVALYLNWSDFDESTVTWSNRPAFDPSAVDTCDHFDDYPNPDIKFTAPDTISTGGWLFFDGPDAAKLVEGWANGTIANYGATISGTGDYTDTARFFDLLSQEHPSIQPYLYVDYNVIPQVEVIVEPTDDTLVDIFVPDSNGSALDIMRIRHQADSWGLIHPMAKFDLSVLPNNIHVNAARFAFWADLVSDAGAGWPAADDFPLLTMYKNYADDWSETNVTWNTAPTYDAAAVDTCDHFDNHPGTGIKFTAPDTVSAGGWLFFDGLGAATLVEDWANGIWPNCGVRIEGYGDYTDSSRYFDLFTEEHPNEELYGMGPYLVVNYIPLPPPYITQPKQQFATSDDTQVGTDDANYGDDDVMYLRYDSNGASYAMAKFDLSPLAGQIVNIKSAKMRFFVNLWEDGAMWPTNFAPVGMLKLTNNWDEATVILSTIPGFETNHVEVMDHFTSMVGGDDVYFTGTNSISEGGWLEFSNTNVVNMVQGWLDDTDSNYGVGLGGDGDPLAGVPNYRMFQIPTKENSSSSIRPQLVIEYDILGYPGWANRWGVGSKTEDNDGDGLNNIGEYGLDGNPADPGDQGTAPEFAIIGGNVQYVQPQRAGDTNVIYTVESTSDLVSGIWTNDGSITVSGTNVTGGTLDFVTNTTGTAENEKFIRLTIE